MPAGAHQDERGGPMLLALLALAAVIFFVLAGLKVSGRRFDPAYFGWACAAVVVLWPIIDRLKG